MKTRFAAIIGIIVILLSVLPARAADTAVSRTADTACVSFAAAERADNAYGTNMFRYLGNGWHYRNGSWYYVRGGRAVTGWVKDNGKWYFLGSGGKMKTGWLKDGGKWYFLNAGGAMKTGWLRDGGKKYYLNTSGAMKTGWTKIKGSWYYFNKSGAMRTGWLRLKGKTYYLTPGGAMKTGWLRFNGKKYYFGTNGALDLKKTKKANKAKSAGTRTSVVSSQTQPAAKETAEEVKETKAAEKETGASSKETEASSKETKAAAKETKAARKKTKGDLVAEYALKFVGNPYVYGGCSLTKGTDCSGFVMLIYRRFGVNLPHYDAAIRVMGKAVPSLSKARAGDIICYYGHVAIYLGDGRIVHASNSRDGIKISDRADYRTIAGIRRIFD